jgi:hypothetical protein
MMALTLAAIPAFVIASRLAFGKPKDRLREAMSGQANRDCFASLAMTTKKCADCAPAQNHAVNAAPNRSFS